jgi:predicted MFS family arabinose efflux permease
LLNGLIGVPGLFAMTGVLAVGAIFVVWRIVPNVTEVHKAARGGALREFWGALRDPHLARLNYGIFVLHAVLMALFIVVPFALRDAGMPVSSHWKVYLPVMLGSFVLMMPAVMSQGSATLAKRYFVAAVAMIACAQAALPWLTGSVPMLALFLLFFFTPFNALEAMLPSLTSRMAPPQSKGVAIGVYSSVQFLGTFCGAAAGGYAYGHWGTPGVVIADVVLLVIWVVIAAGMKVPGALTTRTYDLPILDASQTEHLLEQLRAAPGVREVRVVTGESTAYLKVDSTRFDEHNVLQIIAGQGELKWPRSTK